MRILFTGGGTGGHLVPIIAVAREIRRLNDSKDIKLYYMGPEDQLGRLLLAEENITTYAITSGKIRRYFSFQNVIDIFFHIPLGVVESFFLLLWVRPNLVFSKGGSGSAAVVLSAHFLGIPIFLHESDSAPGQSNRLAYRWAKKTFVAFEKTSYFDLSKTIVVGNPIKKELLEGNYQSAKDVFCLVGGKPLLLFFGGSQGAVALNDFVLSIINPLLASYEIIHVCGKKNYDALEKEATTAITPGLENGYHLYPSLNEIELKHAYKACDFIISRAGSGSIFEIAAVGKPSILIPLPSSANGHQSKNAYQYAATGAAIIIEQENLSPHFFMEKLSYLLAHTEELESMKTRALEFAKPLAAKAIAREILEYLSN